MSLKQQVIFICLALFAINVGSFSLQYKGNMKHPDLPGHCYYEDYDVTIAFNETAYPTNLKNACIKIFCREDYVLEIKHCEKGAPNLKCEYSPNDYSKPYPDCCPVATCH